MGSHFKGRDYHSEETRQWELAAAGHTASTVRKQRVTDAEAPWDVTAPQSRWVFSPQLAYCTQLPRDGCPAPRWPRACGVGSIIIAWAPAFF